MGNSNTSYYKCGQCGKKHIVLESPIVCTIILLMNFIMKDMKIIKEKKKMIEGSKLIL